jgi:hypothetical protein
MPQDGQRKDSQKWHQSIHITVPRSQALAAKPKLEAAGCTTMRMVSSTTSLKRTGSLQQYKMQNIATCSKMATAKTVKVGRL